MKTFPILALLLGFLSMNAQSEFPVHDNGLIYSDAAVSKLKHIVDSLNLKFKVCQNQTFYAAKQARVHAIELSGARSKELKKDLEAGLAFEKIVAKYPRIEVEKDLLLLVYDSEDYDENKITVFRTVEIGESGGREIEMGREKGHDRLKQNLKGKWIFDSHEKTQYSDASVWAFYFVTEVASPKLPQRYSRMITYADCLVDTTAQIFHKDAARASRGYFYGSETASKADGFMADFYRRTNRPRMEIDTSAAAFTDPDVMEAEENRFVAFWRKDSIWQTKIYARFDSIRKADPTFFNLYKETLEDAKQNHRSNANFEDFVSTYSSLQDALELKRNRIVIGGCSQDDGPRIHAQQIALLAAETVKWEIFLRAHLNIMNDRFDRVSDGSYAWQGRKTYIRELEVIDIDLPSLIFGISMRVEKPSDGHYYASIGRTGRALAESKDKDKFAEEMLAVISDKDLDDYNRLLMYFMFDNYNYNLQDREEQLRNLDKMKTAVATLPGYVSSRIKVEDYKRH